MTLFPPLLHCSLDWKRKWVQWSISRDGSLWLDTTPSLDPPKPTCHKKKVGCLLSRPCWVDGGWHALAVDHLEVNSARLPNLHFSPKHPAGWGPPVLSQHGRHVKGDRCLCRKNHGNAEVSRSGGEVVGAAKVPGDGRLWQWPSGEFIKDGGLFCGRCLPRDMNVIRAQLKGQSCSMKCHRTLRGSNVPFRGRLTDAPSSRHTHQRSQQVCTILCCPVTAQTRTHRVEITDLKTCKWILIPPLVGFCFIINALKCLFFHLIEELYLIHTLSGSKPKLWSLSPTPSGLLRRSLGWTLHAFSGCSFIAEVTVDTPVEMISLVFWGEAHHLCRMSSTAFCCLQQFGSCSSELDPYKHPGVVLRCSVSPVKGRHGYCSYMHVHFFTFRHFQRLYWIISLSGP